MIDDTFPTNEEGKPENTQFSFPLYLNTYIQEEYSDEYSDFRSSLQPSIVLELYFWILDNRDSNNKISEALLSENKIFIDGYIVKSIQYNSDDDVVNIETDNLYGECYLDVRIIISLSNVIVNCDKKISLII